MGQRKATTFTPGGVDIVESAQALHHLDQVVALDIKVLRNIRDGDPLFLYFAGTENYVHVSCSRYSGSIAYLYITVMSLFLP